MSNNLELSFPVGIDVVDLPSKGKFYPKDHPLCDQSSLELYHMRGAEEDIITNRDFIKRNVVVDKLLKNLIKDPNLKTDKNFNNMLIADQFMLLLKARITAYTHEYPTTVTCPACKKTSIFNFDLLEYKIKHPNLKEMEDVEYDEDRNIFTVRIGDGSIKVELRPTTVELQKKITNKILNRQNKILSSKDRLEDLIVSINDNTSQDMKNLFFKEAPSFCIKWLENTVDDINIQIDLSQNFECKHCDYSDVLSPPFTSDFLLNPRLRKVK